MPTPITQAQLTQLQNMVSAGNASVAYTWLASNGYNYASWANGVATGTTLAGASAVVYLQNSAIAGIGSEACRNLSPVQIEVIRTDMAEAYLKTLQGQIDRGAQYVARDIDSQEATQFHAQVFTKNNLGISNWTLDTPFKLIERQGGAVAVERYWQGMMQTAGEGLDAMVANTATMAYVFGASKSADPEVRSLAEQWLGTVLPDRGNLPQVMRDIGNAIDNQLNNLKGRFNLSEAEQAQGQALADLKTSIDQMLEPSATQFTVLSEAQITALLEPMKAAAAGNPDASVLLADAGGYTGAGTMTDSGWIPASTGGLFPPQAATPIPAPAPNPYSYTHYLSGAGANLTPNQQTGLALQLDALGLGGESALSFITLPGGGTTLIQNADGDIVGEINQTTSSDNGSQSYTRLSGVRINADGSAEPITIYVSPSGQALTPAQHTQAQYSQAAGAVGLMNSIIGLQHWDDMGDLQRIAAVTSIYNAFDKLSGGNALPLGDLGTAAGVLGLLSALDQGNMGGALYSGLSLVENLTSVAGVANSGWVSLNMPGGGNFLPGLGLVLALDSGDPVSILAAAANFIPGWGPLISVCITLLGGLFADDDQPMLEGKAHAEWDGAGNTIVLTDQDSEGGGATAAGWMSSLVNGLQAQLAGTRDAAGNSYALIPNLLPAIGYQYDPDGFNLANGAKGFLYLQWTDESGQSQTRYYDGQGSRGDDSGETLAGDFMAKAQGAIAPAWQVQTVLAHWQQGQGSSPKRYQVDSCLRPWDKGCRSISCINRQRKVVYRRGRKRANKTAEIFQHLTRLGDAQRLNARQNRSAANDLTWKRVA